MGGIAEVTCDGKVFLLGENQSTYLPRAASTGRWTGQGAAVNHPSAVGQLTGEDDIVRLEDACGGRLTLPMKRRVAAVYW